MPLCAARELLSGNGPGEAAGQAVRGIPSDVAGLTLNMAHPIAQAVPELAMNRERAGSGAEIIQSGAPRRRVLGFRGGEAVKQLGQYAAKKAVPLYGRYTAIEGGEMSSESLLGNVGMTAFKDKPRRSILHC